MYLSWTDLRGANLSEADLRKADLSWADLRGVNQDKATLFGASLGRADLSWASLGGASTFECTKSHLRRRGALFREKTEVIIAEPFSEKAGRYALGFVVSLPFMSVVGFLMGVGIRFICNRKNTLVTRLLAR
jgi:hypothetical protein